MNERTKSRFRIVSAVHLFLIQKDKVLLLRRYHTGYEDGNYSVVAGHLDGDETATQAMVREAEEEAGITIKREDLEVVHVMHRGDLAHKDAERIDFFLTTDHWSGEPRIMEKDKCDDLGWFDIKDLPKNVIPYIRSALDNVRKNVFYSEFDW